MTERINRVAIRQGDAFFAPVSTGWRHSDLIRELARCGVPIPIVGEQGFETSMGRFVDRHEGMRIAQAADQIIRKTGSDDELFSEDIW